MNTVIFTTWENKWNPVALLQSQSTNVLGQEKITFTATQIFLLQHFYFACFTPHYVCTEQEADTILKMLNVFHLEWIKYEQMMDRIQKNKNWNLHMFIMQKNKPKNPKKTHKLKLNAKPTNQPTNNNKTCKISMSNKITGGKTYFMKMRKTTATKTRTADSSLIASQRWSIYEYEK